MEVGAEGRRVLRRRDKVPGEREVGKSTVEVGMLAVNWFSASVKFLVGGGRSL